MRKRLFVASWDGDPHRLHAAMQTGAPDWEVAAWGQTRRV
jgi:hypothetical protein